MKKNIAVSVFLLTFINISFIASAGIIRVPTDYTTIQTALDHAVENDTILVSPGTYYENIIWPFIHGIKLIGAGDTSNTFIDGNHQGRVIYFRPGFFYNQNTSIEGFTIQNGLLSGTNIAKGAGIDLNNAGIILYRLHIRHNKLNVTNNSKGAGLSCTNSDALIINDVRVDHNISVAYYASGGGISIDSSKVTMTNVTLTQNQVGGILLGGGNNYESKGGGIITSRSELHVINSEIKNNYCNANFRTSGGGMQLDDSSTITIEHTSVSENQLSGSEQYTNGGGIHLSGRSVIIIDESDITYNRAAGKIVPMTTEQFTQGGGIYSNDANGVRIHHSRIANNECSGNANVMGAGLYFEWSSAEIENSTISYNKIKGKEWCTGGGIYTMASYLSLTNDFIEHNRIEDSASWIVAGAGVFIELWSDVTMMNVVVSSNYLGNGGSSFFGSAIQVNSGTLVRLDHITCVNNAYGDQTGIFARGGETHIQNSILWDNSSVSIDSLQAMMNIEYSNVKNGYPGVGNMNEDPLFVSDTNYNLQITSPCTRSAKESDTVSFDIMNNVRPMPAGTRADLGAYEVLQTLGLSQQRIIDIKLSPNPFHEGFIISLKQAHDGKLMLHDMMGRRIMERVLAKDRTIYIERKNIPAGTYLLSILDENNEIVGTQKLIAE